jgi:hypothetical protein
MPHINRAISERDPKMETASSTSLAWIASKPAGSKATANVRSIKSTIKGRIQKNYFFIGGIHHRQGCVAEGKLTNQRS